MFLVKYPRLIAILFFACIAVIAAIVLSLPFSDWKQTFIYASSAFITAAFWAAIIAKRIADGYQECSYWRAAVLGGIVGLLCVMTVGIPINCELRLWQMLQGQISMHEMIMHIFIDDIQVETGCCVFATLFFSWYLIPTGSVAAILLRALRRLYEPPVFLDNDGVELYNAEQLQR